MLKLLFQFCLLQLTVAEEFGDFAARDGISVPRCVREDAQNDDALCWKLSRSALIYCKRSRPPSA
jgi:hypothetical protein